MCFPGFFAVVAWLDVTGFAKAAYYPVDPGSSYEIRLDGDVLTVAATALGKRAEHATLWWGP